MDAVERAVLQRFKALVAERVRLHQMILFGSRARGDAATDSDVDVVVITEDATDDTLSAYIRRCAWEAGFESGMVVVPVVFSRDEWENSPQRSSLLALAVKAEGVPV